ncbi:hypothetical protein CCY01nite_36880 [Chitinophaga cymbidii]|uniref:PA14 domain-containing protein n=2 Tax=Chitinophaga cymbidii TaxID=1096750 RepID=A0A512RP02_9BACT|nr:hypothetical protein CCY01nite_36880 [Chitinophaga cymbidii]
MIRDSLPNPAVSFSFTLGSTLRTSAGVYTEDSVLVKTLWSGITYSSGTHTATWDGTTDEGTLAADGNYKVRVLSNNVQYAWEGTIGNNSDADTGASVQGGYAPIITMAVAGQYAYIAKGYSEGTPSQVKFNLNTPRAGIQIQPPGENTGQQTTFVASDSTNVYWAGNDPFNKTLYFIFATRTSDDQEVTFPVYGSPVDAARGKLYKSCIDTVKNENSIITGMAVQPTGKFLFVSHGQLNALHVLDKTTGQLLQTLSYTAPGVLATDTANHLWMAHTSGGSGTIEQFSVDTSGILTSTGVTVSGVIKPLALGVSPDNQLIVAADGDSTSQQLKAYSNLTGAASWTYGLAGGYVNGPDVTNDKFYFRDVRSTMNTFIAFEADGSFWVGDPGNCRVQHYAADRTFIDNILYQPNFYSCFVDYNNPTRVFGAFREYEIDYSKPLARNNGSWKLVKNWGYNVPAAYANQYNILRNVNTLSNGRTYALLRKLGTTKWEVVELPASGNLRFTNTLVEVDNTHLYPDGSLRKVTRLFLNQPTVWSKRELTGFDGANNPQWGAFTTVAKTQPATASDPGYWGDANRLRPGEVTSSGIVLSFDGAGAHAGFDNYHLGGVRVGDSTWLWRVAPSTTKDYNGPFPPDGAYDIGNGVQYSGVSAMAVDRHIFWGYHGEFWKNSQTNKWNHVYDDGLFVGQFGITGPEVAGKLAPAEMAGNAFSANMIRMGDTAYLYHNDEGLKLSGGIHRWRVTGLSTVQEQEVPVSFSMTGNGLLASYYNGTDLNNMRLAKHRIDSTVHMDLADTDLADTTDFSVSWTGYIVPQYSELYTLYANANKRVRLWVNDKMLIDTTGPGEFKDSLILAAGQRYPVRLEIMQDGGGAVASLLWSSSSQPKAEVPYSRLYPAPAPDYSGGYDLLENLPFRSIMEDSMYGWRRDPVPEDYTDQYTKYWSVKTNIKTYATKDRDVYIRFRSKIANTVATVDRDLGEVSSAAWELSGDLNYERNYPNEDSLKLGPDGNGGSFMEVLDDQGRVIVRFFWNMKYRSKDTRLYANNKIIINGHNDVMKPIYSVAQPFSINMSGDSATVTYADFPPVTVAALDTAAHTDKPAKVRFYCWYKSWNSDRIIDISRLKFALGTPMPLLMRNSNSEQLKEPLQPQPPVFKVFPNPVNGATFYIRFTDPVTKDVRVRITDMSGKTVFYKRISGSVVELDRKLPAGVYIVTVNEKHSSKLMVY